MSIESLIADIVREEVARQLAAQRPANATFLSVAEAAKFARVSPATIRRWLKRGELTKHGTDTRVLVDRAELEKYLRRDIVPIDSKLSPEERARRRFG